MWFEGKNSNSNWVFLINIVELDLRRYVINSVSLYIFKHFIISIRLKKWNISFIHSNIPMLNSKRCIFFWTRYLVDISWNYWNIINNFPFLKLFLIIKLIRIKQFHLFWQLFLAWLSFRKGRLVNFRYYLFKLLKLFGILLLSDILLLLQLF